jgi:hypothetical protein
VVTPLGFALKLYEGPGQNWVNNYAAGVLYVIFWCLVAFFFSPRREHITRVAIGVFSVTSVLELLQLWHPAILHQVRASFLGRTLIGTTFAWWDFAHYAIGGVLGWLWMSGISTLDEKRGCREKTIC